MAVANDKLDRALELLDQAHAAERRARFMPNRQFDGVMAAASDLRARAYQMAAEAHAGT